MNYFRDISALHNVLTVLYEKAPEEERLATLSRFLVSSDGFARQMRWEWIDNSNCDYQSCSIDGQRFGRE